MLKNFIIRKNAPNENEKLPTHNITANIGDAWVVIGGCWVKQGTAGSFLSCKLSDAWVDSKDNTKSRKSYVIVAEEEIELPEQKTIDPSDGRDLTPDDSNPF